MKTPRILGSSSEAPPFAGDLPATLGTLAPYTNDTDEPTHLPVVTPALSPPRLRQRPELSPIVTLAVLAASLLTLALSLTISVRHANRRVVVEAPVVPPAAVAASGRDGVDRLHCMWDIVSVTVTRPAAAGDGVVAAWVDATNGALSLVLRPADGAYTGYLYINEGVLRTEPRTAGLPIWPGERVVLRVHGLLDARELQVTGRQTRFGSREEGPCT